MKDYDLNEHFIKGFLTVISEEDENEIKGEEIIASFMLRFNFVSFNHSTDFCLCNIWVNTYLFNNH